MKQYTSFDIQDISSNFRNVARRLSRTDYSQCDSNLKRFINLLYGEELIKDFIEQNNTVSYDIAKIISERDWLSPFEISPMASEEISFEVQLLQYSIDHFDGDFTRLYGTHWYTSAKSTINDEMRKFIEHIIDPLIDHVSEHLRHCFDVAVRREEAEKPAASPSVSAHNSTVVIGSQVGGNVSNQVSITEREKTEANELISAIREALVAEDIPNKEDIEGILQQMKQEVDEKKKPQRGLLTALKVLCKAGTVVIPFVTALMELLS